MKSLITFFILSFFTQVSFANVVVEVGHGSVDLDGDNISVTTLSVAKFSDTGIDLGPGKIGYGIGYRASIFNADTFEANGSTLDDVSFSAHNIFAEVNYKYSIVQVGFNIDLLGFSTSTESEEEGTGRKVENQTTNVLLGNENDMGSLNSQLYIGFDFDPFMLKVGSAHVVIEYEDDGLNGDNDRQQFFDVFFVNAAYKF